MSVEPVTTSAPVSAPVVSLLHDVLRKVEASVLGTIQDHVRPTKANDDHKSSPSQTNNTTMYHPQKDGIDFLDTKNTLLLSYMIDLVVHLRNYFLHVQQQQQQQQQHSAHDDDDDDDDATSTRHDSIQTNKTRLMEMKVLLDKISTGLDRKLRYQIDKVLLFDASSTNTTGGALTHSGTASTFATRTDPLQYRPGMVQQHQKGVTNLSDEDDDDGHDDNDMEDGDSDDGDDDGIDEDDDYKAARQTIRMASVTAKNASLSKRSSTSNHHHREAEEEDDINTDNNLYRAPRFMSTPYPNESHNNTAKEMMNVDGDYDDSKQTHQKEERYKQKLRNSEIVQTLREQLNDHRPDQDDIIGTGTGGGLGSNSTTATTMNHTNAMIHREQHKFLQLQKEKLQFEEDYMIRLPRTKTERKQQQLVQRQQEQNTISSITNDLHQIVSTGSKSNHRNHPPSKYDRHSSPHHRTPSQQPEASSESKRKSVPKNSLQAALFGGDSSSNKKKKKR